MKSHLIKKLTLLVFICGLMFELVYASSSSKKEEIEDKLKQEDYTVVNIGKENVLFLISRFANALNGDFLSEENIFTSFKIKDYVYALKKGNDETGIVVVYLTLDSMDDAKKMINKTCNSETEDKIKETDEESIEDYDINCGSDDYFEYMITTKTDDEKEIEININASRKANTILFVVGSNVEKEDVAKVISHLGYSKQNNSFAYLGVFILIIITIIIVFAFRRKNSI